MIVSDRITRRRAPLTSGGYGNQVRDWSAAVDTQARVQWSAQAVSEVVGDEARTVTRVKILGGPDLDLDATDRIVGPDGHLYEVDGEVMHSYLRGRLHHVRAYLRRIATTS